jgi:plastocyanin
MAEKQVVSTNTMFLLMVVAVVLIFAFLANSFMATGIKSNGSTDTTTGQLANNGNQIQQPPAQQPQTDIYIKALNTYSYNPEQVTVKKGQQVKLHFTAESNVGCGRQLVVYGMGQNISAVSKNGAEQVIEFTPQKEGTFEYNCGMRMMQPGKLVVVP